MRFIENLKQNDSFKEILTGSFTSLVTKVFGIVLNYLLIFIISHKIGVDYVGFYNIILVTLLLTTIVCSLGLNFGIIPLVNKHTSSIRALYKKSLTLISFLVVIALGVFYLFSDNLSNYLFSTSETKVYWIILLIILYAFLFFNIEFIRANKKITVSESLRNILFPVLTLVGILFFAPYFKDKFQLILISLSGALFCSLIPSFIYSIKINKATTVRKDISYKKMLNVASPLMIMGLSSFFLSESSLFILKYYHTINDVGNFTIIYKISIISCLIFTVSSAIIGPKISELFWTGDKELLRKTFYQSLNLIAFTSFPIVVIFCAFPSFFLELFNLSNQYSFELILMLISQFLFGISAIYGLFLMVTDKQKVFRNIYIICALINLVFCFILIPELKILGASIAVSVSYILLNLFCIFYIYKNKLL